MVVISIVEKLRRAQGNLCFHCAAPMEERKGRHLSRLGWTREHIFPRHKYPGMIHNIVLAHYSCNTRRGGRMPTQVEIDRTIALYKMMSMTAFIPADEEAIARSVAANHQRFTRFYWENGKIKPLAAGKITSSQ